jgi:methylsterol monooxygenase/4-alpha-methyl-delta7-sterol-4alpha-methyl oxidase
MIPIYAGNYSFFDQCRIQQHICWPWFDPRPDVREDFWKLSLRSLKFTACSVLLLVPSLVVLKTYANRELFWEDKTFFFRTDDEHWPSIGKNIRDIFSLVLIHEFGFYARHKMMHSYCFLYQYHKVHHEYKINTTLAAQHNHPVDFVVSISGPALLAIALVSTSHSISQFQYLLWTMWANLDNRVGYAFPWSPVRWFPGSAATDEHKFHHSKNMGCYASKLACFNSVLGGYEHYDAYYADACHDSFHNNKKDGANSSEIRVVKEKEQ